MAGAYLYNLDLPEMKPNVLIKLTELMRQAHMVHDFTENTKNEGFTASGFQRRFRGDVFVENV